MPRPAAHQSGPTSVELQILLCLAENPLHGYGIKQEIERRTRGEMKLGSGTLYEAIQRLEAAEFIRETPAPAGATSTRRKRFYGLTPRGQGALAAELVRLDRIVRFARGRRLIPEG